MWQPFEAHMTSARAIPGLVVVAPSSLAAIGRVVDTNGGIAERAFSATGLGMAIARTVGDERGGRMDIRSQVGRGTQGRVPLPMEAP